MPVRLTETAIGSAVRKAVATGRRAELTDAAVRGLRLRVTPAGARTWALSCSDQLGRERRFVLGQHPVMGIADARVAAGAMREQVRQGVDPVADARRKRLIGKQAKEGIGTLAALLDLYGKGDGGKLRSWPEYVRSIGRVFRPFLQRPLADLRLADLQLAADAYEAQQQAALAVRCLRPVLKWASAPGRSYVAAELVNIKPPATPKQRDRVLEPAELAGLLPVLRGSSRPYAAALRFMLLTLARREEVCGARWRDVAWTPGTWTIQAKRSKNGKEHTVPLSRQAMDVLRARVPAGECNPGALIFATETGGRLWNWDRETKALQAASDTGGWHRHDLRRTGATMLGKMGELPDIIEAALNHTAIRSPLAAIYNKARYRPQVAVALQRLADALDGIETGGAEVVPLPARA